VRSRTAGRRPRARAPQLALTALVAFGFAITTFVAWPKAAAAQGETTLKVDPPTQNVSPGQEFVVNIIQSAAGETTGAQVNVTFDPKLVQLKDFVLGDAYTSKSAIFAFGNADLGSNNDRGKTLDRANKFGTLENAAGFLLPGNGVIPPGDTIFLKLTFVAQPGTGGQMTIGLGRGSMIDQNGGPLDPTLVNGAAVVGAGGAVGGSGAPGGSSGPGGSGGPGASGEPVASGEPSVGPSEEPSGTPEPLANPTSPVKVSLAPTSLTLDAGNPARVYLIADSDGNLTSVTADLSFDPNALEITGLEAGPAWGDATIIATVNGSTTGGVDAAIAQANTTGLLTAGAFFIPGTQDLPYGDGVFVSVLVKAKAGGTTNLSIANAQALGLTDKVPAEIDASSLTKPPDKGIQLDPTLVIPLVLLVVIVIASVLIVRSGRIPPRVRRRWPFYLSAALGLIPVVLFVAIALSMVASAAPILDPNIAAIPRPSGQPLPSASAGTVATVLTQTSSSGQALTLGLLGPGLWGAFLVVLIAISIALPVALALAIVAVDFPLGPVTRFVRPIVALFSGVPPVVYAVSVPIFITLVMIPKFAANATYGAFNPASIGADPSTWPPPDVPYSAGGFPWDLTGNANSTLLGGILIALFLIPFLTALFVDALSDVPRAAREASFALGANRTYTIRRVVLPRALPALVGATMLGMLKALGDAIIVGWAVGWSADQFPNPLFDALERTTPLAGQAAGLIGSFETLDASCAPAACAVGYSGALLLLLVAGVFVLLITRLQARARRRVAV
jgi:ABC-type phosphate transport system permease subunit